MVFDFPRIIVDLKHTSMKRTIRINMDHYFKDGLKYTAPTDVRHSVKTVTFKPIELDDFISFILDGYDDEMKPKSTHMIDHYRASLLLKTEDNSFYSQLGTELIMMRNQVMGYILEHVDEDDLLEFRQVGNNYLIDVPNLS